MMNPGKSMDWGAWWAIVCGVTKSWTRLRLNIHMMNLKNNLEKGPRYYTHGFILMHTHTWESEKKAGWCKQRLKWCRHKSKNVGRPPGSKKTAFPLGPPETAQPCRHPDPSQNPYSSHRKLIQRSWVLLGEISHWGTLSWVRGERISFLYLKNHSAAESWL